MIYSSALAAARMPDDSHSNQQATVLWNGHARMYMEASMRTASVDLEAWT